MDINTVHTCKMLILTISFEAFNQIFVTAGLCLFQEKVSQSAYTKQHHIAVFNIQKYIHSTSITSPSVFLHHPPPTMLRIITTHTSIQTIG